MVIPSFFVKIKGHLGQRISKDEFNRLQTLYLKEGNIKDIQIDC